MNWFSEKIAAGMLIGTLVFLAFSTNQTVARQDGLLRVYFLNVGQGDAIFIQAPNGNQVLVDGGPDTAVLSELSRVMPLNDRSIDAVVVSHPHSDHIEGLVHVLDRYEVAHVIQARESYDSSIFRQWQQSVAAENTQEIEAIAGTRVTLGPEVALTILHPFASVAGTMTKTPHNDVVVAVLQYRHVKILLTGDMETEVEKDLIAKQVDIDADVLKVGHHGSTTSTSTSFLSMVTPQVAVIQVGARNRYRHPAPSVLDRLVNSTVTYYRNDTNGTITLTSDGESFTVTPNH